MRESMQNDGKAPSCVRLQPAEPELGSVGLVRGEHVSEPLLLKHLPIVSQL
jgi:hypothetical protein